MEPVLSGTEADGRHHEPIRYVPRLAMVVTCTNYDDEPAVIANKLREWLTQGTSEKGLSTPPAALAITTAEISSSAANQRQPDADPR